MEIDKVILQNFKSFKDRFEFKLNKGLNIIVGDNEAGKSTIIQAIHLVLTGWFNGRYLHNELTQYLFNYQAVQEYLQSLSTGNPQAPPSILIEVYINSEELPILRGNGNSEGSNSTGVRLSIEFDSRYQQDYELLLASGNIRSLPIEYYHFYWTSFAREVITPRLIPVKSALVDSSNNKMQNGSDLYISRIVKDFLDSKEVVDISQAHRKMKDLFMEEEVIKTINQRIQDTSKISNKKVELSVELSSKNAWENSLVTYLDDIPFHHVGKGEQCIVKTKLALSHKKALEANIIQIEEPENHLSHSRLSGLIRDIKDSEEDKQFLISTHSSFVANKLGLDHLMLLNSQNITRLTDLQPDTFDFFQKLAGYDTLRLILCSKAILVEGDSDELIVQRAYSDQNEGKLPIEDGIDVISVGTSFLRFLEIAEKLNIETVVLTDSDGSIEALEKKYIHYLGDEAKDNITILYDSVIDAGDLMIGDKPFNYNTLEPKVLKANDRDILNQIFGTSYLTDDEMRKYMRTNKTECALKIYESEQRIVYPEYITSAF